MLFLMKKCREFWRLQVYASRQCRNILFVLATLTPQKFFRIFSSLLLHFIILCGNEQLTCTITLFKAETAVLPALSAFFYSK